MARTGSADPLARSLPAIPTSNDAGLLLSIPIMVPSVAFVLFGSMMA